MKEELSAITKDTSYIFIGRVFSLLMGMLLNFFAARFLGPEKYGMFMHIFTFLSFFPIIIIMGLNQGLVYYLPKFNSKNKEAQKKEIISTSIIIVFLLSLLFSAGLFILRDTIINNVLNNESLGPLFIASIPIVLLMAIIRLSRGIFRGLDQIIYYLKAEKFSLPVLKVAILLVVYFLGVRYYGILLSYLTSMLMVTLYIVYKIKRLDYLKIVNPFKSSKTIELLKFSLPLLFSGLIGYLMTKLDILMVGYFLKEESVGVYNIALKIATMSAFILSAFNTMFAPTISKLFHENDMEKMKSLYSVITKWALGFNLVFFSIILVLNSEIMNIFGEGFIYGAVALIIISMGQVVHSAVGSAGYIIIMTGHPKYDLYSTSGAIIINFILNYLLIPVYGIKGAAIASLVSFVFLNIFKLTVVYVLHRIHPYNREYIKLIVSFLVSTATGYLVYKILPAVFYIKVIILSILIGLIFLGIYWLMKPSEEDIFIFNKFYKKLKAMLKIVN